VRAADDDDPLSALALAQTTYCFGPGNNPVVRIDAADDHDADEFEIVNKGLLTRAVRFQSRRWGRFEWHYADRCERAECHANSLLVLEKIELLLDPVAAAAGAASRGRVERERRVRVAQLVRSEAYRTPGTRASTAGNGGRLQMALEAEDGRGLLVDEVVVVVTCLVMLKEIDRLRTVQIMAMSAAASGGGP
jgi:hypothetical protein